jgi:hypothetical protein
VSSLADLRAGDIMFARHVRPLAADLLILAGQLTLGQPGYPHHVAVVTQAERAISPVAGGPLASRARIVQAMPSGAEEIEIGAEHWTKDYVYIRPAYSTDSSWDRFGTGDTQANAVARHAHNYIGTPYSFADYVAIEGVHLGIANGPVRRYVTSSKHMICSQLADQSLSDAGWHVFDDGRLPQDVTPAALFEKMMTMPGQFLIPGMRNWVTNGS